MLCSSKMTLKDEKLMSTVTSEMAQRELRDSLGLKSDKAVLKQH